MPKTIKIATRKSPLALWQAEEVKRQLLKHHPDLTIELIKMSTQGDKILDTPLAKIGGKGLFIKELEAGLLAGEADIAVHSMKDVPVAFPEGLTLQTIMQREDPSDAFVSNTHQQLSSLPEGAVVGTSSLRRQSQILHMRPDLEIKSLRGNVNTRLQKLDDGQFDAIILASAGLIRLGFESRIASRFNAQQCIPGIGQGAVGIECRSDDAEIHALLQPLACADTHARVIAERAVNTQLNGGCQAPIAAFAELNAEQLTINAMVASCNGQIVLHANAEGHKDDAQAIGLSAAKQLETLGALPLLAAAGIE